MAPSSWRRVAADKDDEDGIEVTMVTDVPRSARDVARMDQPRHGYC